MLFAEVVVICVGLHVNQVYNTAEILLGTDRKLDGMWLAFRRSFII